MKKIVSVEMPQELFNQIKTEANINLITVSAQIRLILLQYFAGKELKINAEQKEKMLGD